MWYDVITVLPFHISISQSTRPIETKLSRNVTFVFLNILYDIRFIRKSPKMAVTLFMLSDLLKINKCILYIPRRRRVQFLNNNFFLSIEIPRCPLQATKF